MHLVSKAWDHPVDDRIKHIIDGLKTSPVFNKRNAPGLEHLLDDYLSPNVKVDSVQFIRRLLKVFKDSETDGTYSDILHRHTEDEQQKVEEFLAGGDPGEISKGFNMGPSLGCREELSQLLEADCILEIGIRGIKRLREPIEALEAMKKSLLTTTLNKMASFIDVHKDELEGAGILVYYNTKFQNWGLTVSNTPYLTCVPRSVKEIQLIVKFAKDHNMGVRCSGFRHSWSPVFAENGEILISMLNLHEATKLPNFTALPFSQSPPNELETIDMVSDKPNEAGNYLVRVGASCTNERLRRWCVENKTATLPLNVIMVEITLGGSNAPICHGAGRRNMTLSDLVRRIEYIDANGVKQEVTKPEHLRAASGCFGLMGVVTHLTLEMSPMTYARLRPEKIPVAFAVPPPADMNEKLIPAALREPWKNLSPEKRKFYQDQFEQRATNDFYSEWFWFPYSDYAWVNCWNNTTDETGVVSFPDDFHIFLSFIQSFTMNILQNTPLLDEIIQLAGFSEAAVTLISRAAMKALPSEAVTTYLPDGLHFQRAIQNVRVRDMEVEIPLVAKGGKAAEDGKPVKIDYAPVQRAWWDAILLVYANTDTCPMRMPLEMRIMGGSDVVMAPQRYNKLGTCAIEVLTLHSASKIWVPFAQQVLDKWMALKDPNTGQPLKTRPHWAKEWKEFTVNGKPWFDKLRNEDYKAEIREFLEILEDIGKEAGWTLNDLRNRFSNKMLDEMFFSNAPPRKTNLLQSIGVNRLPRAQSNQGLDLENLISI